ncbi:tyrosine-type recombinase/integrase [Nibricoccus sp. IMCC34717]|uniref:tyrosine-type recombinase/integrase n=1 Tax=Nibricoccus sp. IMCC34717 TaxID=3034021 RepID=UPI00384B7628
MSVRLSKTHQDYWKAKLKRRTYTDRDGTKREVPEWQVRMFHQDREAWFNLETANQTAAASKARDIHVYLTANGWEPTLQKFKPKGPERLRCATVGEFLSGIEAKSRLHPRTLRIYSTKFRKLVADIGRVEVGTKAKDRRTKYDPVNGGRKEWLAKVEALTLDVLTTDSVIEWRGKYIARAGSDPVKRRSAEVSAASIIRAGRALFQNDATPLLKLTLPPNPFIGVKVDDPGPQRYRSEVSAEFILRCAERELKKQEPQQYLALVLCLVGGLRRREADTLLWEQIDLEEGQIHVRRTPYFSPKTDESERDIDLSGSAIELVRKLKEGAVGEFVLEGVQPDPGATYGHYRCDGTWRDLIEWLRSKGISSRNAIHVLRKESGSLVADTFGIEAARQFLGHRDISLTSSTYVSKKKRIEISLPLESPFIGEKGA